MNLDTLQQMEKYEQSFWWHVGKKRLVSSIVKGLKLPKTSRILEIGCGAGEISRELMSYGNVCVNDIAEFAIQKATEKGVKETLLGDINEIDTHHLENSFDLVVALDVLEHIQDDCATIEKVHKLLKPGGIFLINVPAYKFLWSQHDEALQHKRRYTRYEIATKVRDRGFNVIKNEHFVFFAFPGIAVFKVLSNFISRNPYPKTSYILLPERLNTLMIRLLDVEIKLLKYINLPLGTTITLTAKKPEDSICT